MARLKTVFFSHSAWKLTIKQKLFSTPAHPPNWNIMSEKQRVNYALSEDNPDNADVAYLKALGFLKLGPDFTDQAIAALKLSISLSKETNLAASYKLAELYNDLGKEHLSFIVLKKCTEEFKKAIVSGDVSNLIKDAREKLILEEKNNSRLSLI